MSLIPAIRSANNEKHGAAGAEEATFRMCDSTTRIVFCSSDVMDDLIHPSHRLQLPTFFFPIFAVVL